MSVEIAERVSQIASINPEILLDYFPEIKAIVDNSDPNGADPVSEYMWKTLEDGFVDAANTFTTAVEGSALRLCKKHTKSKITYR